MVAAAAAADGLRLPPPREAGWVAFTGAPAGWSGGTLPLGGGLWADGAEGRSLWRGAALGRGCLLHPSSPPLLSGVLAGGEPPPTGQPSRGQLP